MTINFTFYRVIVKNDVAVENIIIIIIGKRKVVFNKYDETE